MKKSISLGECIITTLTQDKLVSIYQASANPLFTDLYTEREDPHDKVHATGICMHLLQFECSYVFLPRGAS